VPRRAHNDRFLTSDKLASASALLVIAFYVVVTTPYAHACAGISLGSTNASYVTSDQTGYVPGELIIGLAGESKETLEKLLTSWNAKIIGELPEIQAYLVRVEEPSLAATLHEAKTLADFSYVEPNYLVHSVLTPNDPQWALQWGLAKVRADLAWDLESGTRSVIVAVVDTGIDYLHEDLAASYLSLGYDWVNHDSDPMDDNGHGTRVAGIIGAVTNNGLGVAGLAQVSLMTEKVLDSSGSGTVYDAAQGVIHAVGKGAKITNNSYGNYVYSDTLKAAFEFARNQGVLNIAAAGNDNTNQPFYPAAFGESVISVAGTDQNDAKYASSNYGDWIELSAPAVDIVSTLPGNLYGTFTGTSMSSAFVSGAAALMLSHCESMSADEVRRRLWDTVVDLGTPGRDPFFGYGRIDVFSTLRIPCQITQPPPVGGTTVEPNHTHIYLSIVIEVALATMVILGTAMLVRSPRNLVRKIVIGN
jgi:thermitase